MIYQMQKQLVRGEKAEALLDEHFSDRFKIILASRAEQRSGIDRIFEARAGAKQYTVEYKTDWTAGRTHNAFIETVSVDTMNVPGWAYTSQAEWLIYYVPDDETIYLVRFADLRKHIEEWIEQFGPEKFIPNDGYYTRGVAVPLDVFVICSSRIETIGLSTPKSLAEEEAAEDQQIPEPTPEEVPLSQFAHHGTVLPEFGPNLGAFAGIPSFMRQPVTRDLTGIDVAVVGIPFDGGATSWRSGTRMGPRHIRAASTIMWGHHSVFDVAPLATLKLVDYGDVDVDPTSIALAAESIEREISTIVSAGPTVLALGGDHSIALPLLRAHAQKYGPLALIQFDSHNDTSRRDGLDHGTPFRRAIEEGILDADASIQLGIRGPTYPGDRQAALALGITVLTIDECFALGMRAVVERVHQVIGERQVYLSFDVDAADPAYAPGTGTPEIGGFTSYQILQLLRGLRGLNLIGMDIVEVSPPYDHGEITSILAANVAFEFLTLLALNQS